MLDRMKINALISPLEANYIISHSGFKWENTANSKKTYQLSKKGIREISIWFDVSRMMSEPLTDRYCTINATIDGVQFAEYEKRANEEKGNKEEGKKEKTAFDYIEYEIKQKLPEEPDEVSGYGGRDSLEWKINSVTYTYTFKGYLTETYYRLLRGGYDLPRYKLKRMVSKKLDDDGYQICTTEYTGVHSEKGGNSRSPIYLSIILSLPPKKEKDEEKENALEAEIKEEYKEPIRYIPEKKSRLRLQIAIRVRKKRIGEICRQRGIANYNLKQFLENKDKIEEEIFEKYMSLITGGGNFYKYKEAEQRIFKRTDFSKKEKNKMCDVLRAVASYKGIANYLSHVEDKEIVYDSMASVRRKTYARKVLRDLEVCGINPLTLPVRTEFKEVILENLITVYKNGKLAEKEETIEKELKKSNAILTDNTEELKFW